MLGCRWGVASEELIQKAYRSQNKAIKIIFELPSGHSSDPRCKKHYIESRKY